MADLRFGAIRLREGYTTTGRKIRRSDPEGEDVAQLLEHRTVTPLTQVRFPGAARDFSPGVNFQCRLSYVCPYTPV